MGKSKAKTTKILETKLKVKSSMQSHSQKLKGINKKAKQIKKAVENIDNIKNGEYVRLLSKITHAKSKTSNNGSTQLVSKLTKDDDVNLERRSRVIFNGQSTKINKKDRKGKSHPGEIEEQCVKKQKATSSENGKCENYKRKSNSYSRPSCIDHSTILKAVVALKQLSSAATGKKVLFDDDAPVFLQFTLVKIPNKSVNTAFELPHSLVTTTSEVCLITPDLSKGYKKDHESTIDSWNNKLRAANVTKVNTVLPFRQLRVEYDQFELKRRLYTQYDFILVDSRLLSHAAHLLGKMFSNSHNKFIPVRIYGKDIKKSIDKALQTGILKLKESATGLISVAHNEMSVEEIVNNIESVVKQLEERFPGGEGNIRALHIKLPTSPAVPIYITLKPNSTVDVPKVIKQQPKAFRDFEDELSTYSGEVKVKVMPEGRLLVTKEKLQQCDSGKEDITVLEEAKKKKKRKLVKQQDGYVDYVEDVLDLQGVAEGVSDERDSTEEEDKSDDE